jgi:hypothetical protein
MVKHLYFSKLKQMEHGARHAVTHGTRHLDGAHGARVRHVPCQCPDVDGAPWTLGHQNNEKNTQKKEK